MINNLQLIIGALLNTFKGYSRKRSITIIRIHPGLGIAETIGKNIRRSCSTEREEGGRERGRERGGEREREREGREREREREREILYLPSVITIN